MGWPCRCRKCGARNTLRKHPEQYIRPPQCQVCGKREHRVDGWMLRRDTRAMGCQCAGYAWAGNMSGAMHRRGSLHCHFRHDGSVRLPGDPDFNDINYVEPI